MRLRLSHTHEVILPDGSVLGLAARDAALLAWLAIEGPTQRDRLGAMLWPAASQTQARTVLRQRLFKLKRSLSRELVTGASRLALATGLSHDLDGSAHLLGQLTLGDAPEFDAWLDRQRAIRADAARNLLRNKAQVLEEQGDVAGALRLAQALLREEPLSEAAHQCVMRLHYLSGDRASAVAAFDACEFTLKHELSTTPSSSTLALLRTIERAKAGEPSASLGSLPLAVLRPPVTVGRASEQRRLAQAWDARHVAMVIGEAGMGKSRLLRDFADTRAGLLAASARPGDVGVPFASLARLLRSAADAGAGTPSDPAMRSQLARVLREFDEPIAAEVPSHGARLRLQQALVGYLERVPRVQGVVFDDLHFADAASLEMLHSLMTDESLADLRWVVALRPSETGTALANLCSALTGAARAAAVDVAPLDERALAELIDTLGLDVAASSIAPRMWRQTGGNPLFALETLKQAWLERRLEASWEADLPRPQSVDRLIDQRVARLSPGAANVARLASIAGVDFSVGLAESVLCVGAIALTEAFRELETAQVLKGTSFVHDLVFDAVLRSVPAVVAAHTRLQVAAWLEHHDGEPARIAQHWIDGNSPARAAHWLGLAAQGAARALRNVEQLSFLERKADLELAAGDRAAAFTSQVEAIRIGFEVDRDASRAQARCDRLATLASTPAQALVATMQRADLAMWRWDDALAERLAAQALAEASRLGDGASAVACRIVLVISLLRLQRPHEALAQAQACVDWVFAHGSPIRQAELHTYFGLVLGELGQQEEALAHHRSAIALAREVDAPQHLMRVLGNMARTLSATGEVGECLSLYTQALQITRMHEAPPANTAVSLMGLADALQRTGHYAQALARLDEAERLVRVNYAAGKVPLSMVWLTCWERLGQWARLKQLATSPALRDIDYAVVRVRVALADHALRRSRGDHSDAGLQSALEGLPTDGGGPNRDTLMLELTRQLPLAAALAQLDAVRARCMTNGFIGHVLASHLYAAEALTGTDAAAARHHAQAALELAETHDYGAGYRVELWLICGNALMSAGDIELGREVLRRGRGWILECAREHVPAEFRDSFLRRNPVNQALLALVDRLDAVRGEAIGT